jgi:hypothetical protein
VKDTISNGIETASSIAYSKTTEVGPTWGGVEWNIGRPVEDKDKVLHG